ncbi:hypothetical protein GORHZ_118_00720 [Gordonia rhizosphera NBRC 16068]|uniref:NAD-dependent epimerase/dehydratase domain-containing protein n=1 Tax=Gordonia rhizosphera NBRC 16068 TaxID=1108045 RepID=K6VVF7_9ACTN|nr:hypothetical protein GORHZ_118_00720 [Gordonia rhizosphera NBRC 16068]
MSAPAGRLIPAFVDMLDSQGVVQVLADHEPEAIVHLAAVVPPASYRNPQGASEINVEGTRLLLAAARRVPTPPFMVLASSAAVYGSRNPHRHPELVTAETPVNPIDRYGQDKVVAEAAVAGSGLPYCILRLGGIISPDVAAEVNRGYLLLMRATPGDNPLHTVDSRDAGLALANACDRRDLVAGKVLMIGGDSSHVHTHRDVVDDLIATVGLGHLGGSVCLPGDPNDEHGWAFTGWFDTAESQALLDFQQHDWASTVHWVAQSQARRRLVLRPAGPVLRPLIRVALALQRRSEHRGPYADPWRLISATYGAAALAQPLS